MSPYQLTESQAVILYFTAPHCNVCKVLKPKILELIKSKYPEMNINFIDVSKYPKVAAQFQVFTIPVILVYFEGREFYRKARNLSLFELEKEISRPYQLLFKT
jgi:thioredoxin-like negative regulator of GroEL